MIGNCEYISLGVHESRLDSGKMAHFASSVEISLSGVESHSTIGDSLHFWAQQFPGVWKVGQKENDDDSNEDSDGAFDDVKLVDSQRSHRHRNFFHSLPIARMPCHERHRGRSGYQLRSSCQKLQR